ncbi:MAG: hypothetical protein KGJ44_07755 [Betaproteobacteria bacterium]|nr:hypothetical protein [Betaproteobacteria bacterium]
MDPQGVDAQRPHSFNRYAYAANNPLRYGDPDGRTPLDLIFLVTDVVQLGHAIYTGEGRTEAIINVGLSAIGVISPVVATGLVLKAWRAERAAEHVAQAARVVAQSIDVEKGVAAAKTAGQLGKEGEAAVRAVYDIGEKPAQSILMNGRGRIPDGINPLAKSLSEVKNVDSLSFTRQLRDYSEYAQSQGLRFDLYTRPSTKLSGPLQDAIDSGLINHLRIP